LGYDETCVPSRFRLLIAAGMALALTVAPSAARAKTKPKPKVAASAGGKTAGKGKAAARAQPKDPPLPPPPQGKVVVFTFAGEGGHRVQQQVVSTLRAKGLKVITNLRPVDSAEQYREMSVTLNFVAFVDGEYVGDGDQASATVYIRSGVTGLRTVSTTFAGEKRTLPAEIGKGLWDRISPDLSRICVDAAKPRKAERAPLRIEAGTPLENRPADAAD
jgi:hypothetical protein